MISGLQHFWTEHFMTGVIHLNWFSQLQELEGTSQSWCKDENYSGAFISRFHLRRESSCSLTPFVVTIRRSLQTRQLTSKSIIINSGIWFSRFLISYGAKSKWVFQVAKRLKFGWSMLEDFKLVFRIMKPSRLTVTERPFRCARLPSSWKTTMNQFGFWVRT